LVSLTRFEVFLTASKARLYVFHERVKTIKRAPRTRKERRDDADALKRFVERFSLTLSESGVPRMAARIFVALLVDDDGRMTAAEIADYLRISRAAISIAVRILVQASLIVREREPGQAVDHYRVLDDVWIENTLWKDAAFRQMETDLEIGTEVLSKDSAAWRRVEETRQFFAFAREELAHMMVRWRSRRAELRLRARPSGSRGNSR
jgi:DNA-binding transcriptional regulator GbsR (MarR family)